MTLAIVAAMQDELSTLLDDMGRSAQRSVHGRREFFRGELWGTPCVAVLSRIGKVAAAATVTTLIHEFAVERIVFTGVAGGIGAGLRVGDVVVANELVQHDFDASPIFPRHEIPLLGLTRFATDPALTARLERAAQTYLRDDLPRELDAAVRAEFALGAPHPAPACRRGLIASGDEFVSDARRVAQLRADFPDLLAVEMEGAAVAQVCHEFDLPFAVVRTISDAADDSAHVDFTRFVGAVASRYSHGILRRLLA